MRALAAVSASGGPLSDTHDFRVVNDFSRHTGWLHGFLAGYSSYGIALLALLILAGWWLARRSGSARMLAVTVWTGAAVLVAVAINQPIVNAVGEPRPFVALPHVLLLVQHAPDAGFPSDHLTAAGAAVAGLFLASRRLGVAALLVALLLAFSRVYVGVHYPQDVLAGLALGAVVALVGALVVVRPLTALVERLSRTRARPLLVAGVPEPAPEPSGVR